jgi:cobyrinic acid a,c-diamide synthase
VPETQDMTEHTTCNPQLPLTPPPRFVIGAPQGRSGKTTVSLAITLGLVRRGLKVRCFKKGPDFIDPSWLRKASGQDCHNLDGFMMPQDVVKGVFATRSAGNDVALVEGAMGLFDGHGEDGAGTVADLARLIGAPIVLVVNAARMTQSVAAMVGGYQHFEENTQIAGVIFNNVAGARHLGKLTIAIENHCHIPVLGAIPKSNRLAITERHLGLVPSMEDVKAASILETISEVTESHLDLDGLMAVARSASPLDVSLPPVAGAETAICRIGVIRDKAFSFYYPENLEALEARGAEIIFLDSLSDQRLPRLDGLYIGGGFPELYAAELQANVSFRAAVADAVENGLPVYAECGGLMYLCRTISWQGRSYEMVGAILADVELTGRPQGHGYVQVEATADNPLFPAGQMIRGHEFHHSKLLPLAELTAGYKMHRGRGIDGKIDGVCHRNMLGAYTHVHALGAATWAGRFVGLASQRRFSGDLIERPERTKGAGVAGAMQREIRRRR